jgi:hypothetical protein
MAKGKPKLHELLAVEGDLEGLFKKILAETIVTFTKREDHFKGAHRKLEMLDARRAGENDEEFFALTTTVADKLDYTSKPCIRYIDAILQKEATNQEAKADLIVDGETITEQLPATFLLGMESRLAKIREVYAKIPTLSPGVTWELDPDKGKNVFRSKNPETTFKTEKKFKVQVLYEAKFPKEGESGQSLPAQVEKIPETENVGRYTRTLWSGMMSTAEKSEKLARIDRLIRAVKKARQRANMQEQVKVTIGKKLFDYING